MNQGPLLEERLQDICMPERTLGLGWRCDEQVMVTKEEKELPGYQLQHDSMNCSIILYGVHILDISIQPILNLYSSISVIWR